MHIFTLGLIARAAADTAADAGAAGGFNTASILQFLPFILLIAVFWFVLIRPENKKKKALQQMLSNLEVGMEITTIGKMVGKIVAIKDDLITFETGEDRVRIQVTRDGIGTVSPKESN